MKRPRRAAAARAATNMPRAADPDSPVKSRSNPVETPSPTPRRLRHAAYRTGKRAPRPLDRRRTDFERIAKHHIDALRNESPRPASSSATDLASDASSELVGELELTPAWAQRILEDDGGEDKLVANMKGLLQRLRGLDNINEEEGVEGDVKNRPGEKDDLHGLAGVLSAERFISHDSSRLRLLTACAMAEILRISAPDPPIAMHKMNQVCSLLIEQLAVLVSQRDDMEMFRFSLLEQLACVKAFVIFCDDEDIVCDLFACFYATVRPHQPDKVRQYFADILVSLVDEAEELGYPVLDALVAPLVPGLRYSESAVALSEKVVHAAANAVQVPLCNMLNASVRHLKHSPSVVTPEKGGRRRTPVKRRHDDDDEDAVEHSTHHEHMSDLIVALNRIASELLIYVIPGLEDRIHSKEEAVRLANVSLLAQLFTSRTHMVESYPSLFGEFLSRQNDVSSSIRAEVSAAVADLIVKHPKYRESLDKILQNRALDKDEHVRVTAVRSIGAAVDVASEQLLQTLASRLRDKKAVVRSAALAQLYRIYNGNDTDPAAGHSLAGSVRKEPQSTKRSSARKTSDDEDEEDDVVEFSEGSDDMQASHSMTDMVQLRKFPWLPDKLIQAHMALKGAGDHHAASEVEQLIFERIPRLGSCDAGTSLRRFALFVGCLCTKSFAHLVQITSERRRCCDALLDLVNYRIGLRKNTGSAGENPTDEPVNQARGKTFSRKAEKKGPPNTLRDPPKESVELQRRYEALSRLCSSTLEGNEDTLNMCSSLARAPDLKVFEKILIMIDVEAAPSDRDVAYRDVLSRIGSKSPLGNYLRKHLFPKCVPGVFTSTHFAAACAMATSEPKASRALEAENDAVEMKEIMSIERCGVLRYLELVSQHVLGLLQRNVKQIQSLAAVKLKLASPEVLLIGLRLLSRLPESITNTDEAESLRQFLVELMLEDKIVDAEHCASLAKWATRAFINLDLAATGVSNGIEDVLQSMVSRLDSFDGDFENIIAPMTSLSQIAKHSRTLFQRVALQGFDFARALLCGSFNEKLSVHWQKNNSQRESSKNHDALSWRKCTVPPKLDDGLQYVTELMPDRQASLCSVIVHRAVKLLVHGLDSVDSSDELDNVFETLLDIILAKNGNVFGLKQESKDAGDDDIEDTTSSVVPALCASSRLSAGRGMLFLARHPKFFRQLSPPIFVSAILLAQDEQPRVRLAFVEMVATMIVKKRLPFRWVIAMPLMSVDPVRENVAVVRSLLGSLVRHRRRVFEKARLGATRSSGKLLPEVSLPELIWVLANLPDVEIDREAGFPESEKCLEFLMERLLESNEYAGVMHEYIESLSIAQDATEPEDFGPGLKTERISELARRAGNLLKKKQAGKKWNLVQHPGNISLPKDMFRIVNRNAETSGVPPPSLLEVARQYDKDEVIHSDKTAKPSDVVTRVKGVKAARTAAHDVLDDNQDVPLLDIDSPRTETNERNAVEALIQEKSETSAQHSSSLSIRRELGKEGRSPGAVESLEVNEKAYSRTAKGSPGNEATEMKSPKVRKSGRKRSAEKAEHSSPNGSASKAAKVASRGADRKSPSKQEIPTQKDPSPQEQGITDEANAPTDPAGQMDHHGQEPAPNNATDDSHAQRTLPRSRQLQSKKRKQAIQKKVSRKALQEKPGHTKVPLRRSARNRRL